MEEYVLALTLLAGLYMAWSLGANDVANAMGTSVGSGALTLGRAILVAGLFEFAGAVFVGRHVTETIRKGIVAPESFPNEPIAFVIGMASALLAAALWLNLATYFGWPVSTTHSIVGAVLGFGLAAGGGAGVSWHTMGRIVLSWVVSPVCGGLIGYACFRLIRQRILAARDPAKRMLRWGPVLVAPVGFVLTMAMLFKGLKNLGLDFALGDALLLSTGVGLTGAILSRPLLARIRGEGDRRRHLKGRVERAFGRLQVVTACFVAFAHGSNDVANAVGPVAGVLTMLETGVLAQKITEPPLWLFLGGGLGIVLGLATYGYRVIRTIGERITEMTPTRGFSAEFAGATTILVGSKLGLPISTTHTLVGSVIGVGLARGMGALQLGVIKGILLAWLIEVPLTATLAALFYVFAGGLVLGDRSLTAQFPVIALVVAATLGIVVVADRLRNGRLPAGLRAWGMRVVVGTLGGGFVYLVGHSVVG